MIGVNPPGMYSDHGYNQGAVEGNILQVSGQLGLSLSAEGGEALTAHAEARQALDNVEKVVKAAGGDLSNVIGLRFYLASREHLAAMMAAIHEVFPGAKPATTGVVAGLLVDEARLEVEATAVLPSQRG